MKETFIKMATILKTIKGNTGIVRDSSVFQLEGIPLSYLKNSFLHLCWRLELSYTRYIDPMFCQCWFTVFDAGPASAQHRINVLRLLGYPRLNPLTAKLFNLNFHPLEIVHR